MQEYEVSVMFSNTQDTGITFIVEPWGETFILEPHANLTLFLRSCIQPSPPQTVEVVYDVDRMTVYGWVGSTFTLFQNGEKVSPPGPFEWPRVPGTPIIP